MFTTLQGRETERGRGREGGRERRRCSQGSYLLSWGTQEWQEFPMFTTPSRAAPGGGTWKLAVIPVSAQGQDSPKLEFYISNGAGKVNLRPWQIYKYLRNTWWQCTHPHKPRLCCSSQGCESLPALVMAHARGRYGFAPDTCWCACTQTCVHEATHICA